MQELLGCAGQVQLLSGAAELLPGFDHLLFGGLLVKAHEHGSGVAVGNRYAEALCGDDRLLGIDDVVALNMTPQLERLTLALFFLAADVGDDVIHDLGHAVKGLAGTGDGLIGAHQRLADAEVLHQRVQGGNIALQAAVGLDSDEAALGAQTLALSGNDLDVIGIDLGHHHGHIRGKAVCAVVGDHRALGLCIGFFQCLDLILRHVDGAENEIHLRGNFFHLGSVCHDHLLHALRHGGGHGPAGANGLLVRFA